MEICRKEKLRFYQIRLNPGVPLQRQAACFCLQMLYNESMKMSTLNARIPTGLKKAVNKFCEERGLKVQAFIENLIQERLEDEEDQHAIETRREEPTVPLKDVVKALGLEQEFKK